MGEKILTGALIVIGILGLVFLLCFINAFFVAMIWNWLVPILVPGGQLVGVITYWQAWGISFLCATLFKSTNYQTQSKD